MSLGDRKLFILVVDDDEGMLEVLEDYLSIHEVLKSPDGVHGIQMLEKHPVDLVITDVRMPFGSGQDLLKVISEEHPHVPVILISGEDSIEIVRDGLDQGAVSFLYKPFTKEEILAELDGLFAE